jgi:superfamily II DNA/RNA helicase
MHGYGWQVSNPAHEGFGVSLLWTDDGEALREWVAIAPPKEQEMQMFEELGVSSPSIAALEAAGITEPFEVQKRVLPLVLQGEDMLVRSPTGSGKTLAFALPIVETVAEQEVNALVLVPTRELALQVAEEIEMLARAHGFTVAAVYGGADIRAQGKAVKDARIVVATPGRLQDMIERRMIDLRRTTMLVLDEADRMLDMGFKPQVDKIVRSLPAERQTLLFSATFTPEIEALAASYTSHPARIEAKVDARLAAGVIDHRFLTVEREGKSDALVGLLEETKGLTLVFVQTKRGADKLAGRLRKRGVKVVCMHGDMTQSSRERSLAEFTSGVSPVLVATDVAARGIDVDDVAQVVNYDAPQDTAAYTHRTGRTGRAGRSGIAVTLVLPEERAEIGRVARVNGQAEKFESDTGVTAPRAKLLYSSRKRSRGSRW